MILNVKDDFDLKMIAESGQCFRWEETGKNSYRILHSSFCLIIERTGRKEYALDCTEKEYGRIWRPYLDMDENYSAIRRRIDAGKDPFLKAASNAERGIRILRQDPWETLISFIISQNRNIPAIKNSINMLASMAGRRKKDSRGNPYHTFPTPEALSRLTFDDLKECHLGYRADYVHKAACAVASGGFSLRALEKMSDGEALDALTSLKGVGPKVASCMMLFGLHRLDSFPVDVWMKKILANEYPDGYPLKDYSPFNGVYQQYMFAYYRGAGR